MNIYLIFIVLVTLPFNASGDTNKEDEKLTTSLLLTKDNYPFETHHITTDDGYILEVYRIPSNTKNAKVVLMVHGLLGTSTDYILLGPKKALAYLVADAGFDVWLLNARGGAYSRNHTNLSPEQNEFWDFSFEEMGLIDLPNTIDYILKLTKQTQLDYIGYSQGTTMAFIFLSMKPEYNDKIRNVFTLAPVAFMKHVTNLFFVTLGPVVQLLGVSAEYIGHGELALSPYFSRLLIKALCSHNDLLCDHLFYLVLGYGSDNIEYNMYLALTKEYKRSSSSKQIAHFSQFIRTPYFRRYNYGLLENFKRYGKSNPPEYDLSKIRTKVYLYYSDRDTLSTKKDVEYLASILPNSEKKFYEKLNHLDMMYGKTAPHIYKNILTILKATD